jgi:putative ABC transport system permease protein
MMTGQILGGSNPMVAVKYQIAIILAIFAATEISTMLALIFSLKKGILPTGFLNRSIFRKG